MADFIPQAVDRLKSWLLNFKSKFLLYATTTGIGATEQTSTTNDCDTLIGDLDAVTSKKAELQSVVQTKKTDQAAIEPRLRATIKRMKTHASYTPAMGEDMDVVGESAAFDASTYKPKISGQAFKGYNQINFEKGHPVIDGVNIYGRAKGTTDWGAKISYDTNSPYPHSGISQGSTFEYMAIGVIDDFEAGLPSDIIEITAI